MRILVTGANGMLGTDLCRILRAAGHETIPTDHAPKSKIQNPKSKIPDVLDVTDSAAVERVLSAVSPNVVIHCAAYTNVDRAEQEPDAAYRVNAIGSWNVAAVCAARDIALCAISTDFVFDGTKSSPYTEFDTPRPINVYGASKFAGEECVRRICRKYWIVRTAWLYGLHGRSFPDSILTAAMSPETKPELRVVTDQRGSPTYTVDLAEALVQLIESPLYGTYHITNGGETSRFDFARKTLELAGMDSIKILPITSSEWPTPASRPANSTLRRYALELQGAPLPRAWEEALADFIRQWANPKSKI